VEVAQNVNKWWGLMNMIMNFEAQLKGTKFLDELSDCQFLIKDYSVVLKLESQTYVTADKFALVTGSDVRNNVEDVVRT
jgi:hypothetical protein